MDVPEKDAERPLTPVGQREVVDIAIAPQSLGAKFDVVASSPLKRALQTAEITGAINRWLSESSYRKK